MSKFDAMSSEELCSEAQKLRVDSDTIKQFCDGELAQEDLTRIIAQVISRTIMFNFEKSLQQRACMHAYVRAHTRARTHARACVIVCCVYPF